MTLVQFTIEQWAEQEQDLIDQFVIDWFKQNIDQPEKWPLSMSAGEWDEQFQRWHNDCAEKTPEQT